jgi:hypothetical protein
VTAAGTAALPRESSLYFANLNSDLVLMAFFVNIAAPESQRELLVERELHVLDKRQSFSTHS